MIATLAILGAGLRVLTMAAGISGTFERHFKAGAALKLKEGKVI